jgi:hypothetical protein
MAKSAREIAGEILVAWIENQTSSTIAKEAFTAADAKKGSVLKVEVTGEHGDLLAVNTGICRF